MKIITTHVSRWRNFLDAEKYLFIDTTYKSGDRRLAPSKALLHGYKYHGLEQDDYRIQFKIEMRQSYANHPELWEQLVNEERIVVLGCYCPSEPPLPPEFCHRNLLVDYFKRICGSKQIPFTYLGEK
jgi:uncharacterized protein YeaO (DUF488 family)